MNIELIIVCLTAATGIGYCADKFYFAAKRGKGQKANYLLDFSRSTFFIFVLVLLLRSFIAEPFRIPSKSLAPSLLPGDFILVNKFSYGLRWPLQHGMFLRVGKPERGDIMVFRWPLDTSIYYIKRVIGVPGDHIDYLNKVLFINGKRVPQKLAKGTMDPDMTGRLWAVNKQIEQLPEKNHFIYQRIEVPAHDLHDIVVPTGYYFVLGDNRDDSSDSRVWGFVPQADIVGKAVFTWLSWDSARWRLRWHRLGFI